MTRPSGLKPAAEEDEFIFEVKPKLDVGHGRHPFNVDLRVLRDGRPATQIDPGISGRPELAKEVLPAFRRLFQSKGVRKPTTAFESQKFLSFWRFLDILFAQVQERAPESIKEPITIDDIQGTIWGHFKDHLASRDAGNAHYVYWIVKRVLEMAAEMRGADHRSFWLPPNPFPQPKYSQGGGDEPYSEQVVRKLAAAATLEHRAIEKRFQTGAELAARGEDPRTLKERQNSANLHPASKDHQRVWNRENSLWFVQNVVNLEPMTIEAFFKRFGFQSSVLVWPPEGAPYEAGAVPTRGLGSHLRWFVPAAVDVIPALLIVVLRTGWNESVVLDLNCEDWFVDQPEAPETAVVMYSQKGRAGGRKQFAHSLKRKKGHAYDVVRQVIKWTEPLRQHVRRCLETITAKIAERAPDDPETAALEKERDRLLDLKNRVWLCLSLNPIGVTRLKADKWFMNVANRIIAQHEITDENGELVRWRSRRARDAWAMFVYESSGYNLIVTQIALGHKGLETLLRYLHHKSTVTQNRRSMWNLQRNLISEIQLARGVRPGVLRHLVKNGSITEEERIRLESGKTRTRCGLYCADPTNPDPEVDPGHRPGEICGSQNCLGGCSKGFASYDSLPHIAKTIVDLRRARANCPLPQWETSDWKVQLEFAEFVFAQYAPDLRAKALSDAEQSSSPHLVFVPSSLRRR